MRLRSNPALLIWGPITLPFIWLSESCTVTQSSYFAGFLAQRALFDFANPVLIIIGGICFEDSLPIRAVLCHLGSFHYILEFYKIASSNNSSSGTIDHLASMGLILEIYMILCNLVNDCLNVLGWKPLFFRDTWFPIISGSPSSHAMASTHPIHAGKINSQLIPYISTSCNQKVN